MTNKQSKLTIPNDLQYLPLAIQFVKINATLRGFSAEESIDLEHSAEEVISFIIQNAFKSTEEASFDILCEQIVDGISIIVKDKGIPFDPQIMEAYNPGAKFEELDTEGLSWFLIRQYVDELEFKNLGKQGKAIVLKKYLAKTEEKNVESSRPLIDKEEVPTKYPPKSVPFRVRRSKPEDSVEIARCIYDAFAYTYGLEDVYHPDRLGQHLASGKIISVVAETKNEHKDIMAHNALVIHDPNSGMAEMAMTLTKDEYQNQGCGKQTGLFLVKEAIKKGLYGIWGTAVTFHPYSQKGLVRSGVKECAIILGNYSNSIKLTHFSDPGQRVSNVVGYFKVPLTSLFKFKKKPVYLPVHHEAMIQKIYKNLNEKPAVKKVKGEPNLPASPSKYTIKEQQNNQRVEIRVATYGADFLETLKMTITKMWLNKNEVIVLYLPLTDPTTAKLTTSIEALGFQFSGIFPGPKKGDQLILQILNNQLVNYDKIILYSDFSKDLLEYIKRQDKLHQIISRNTN